MCERGLSGALHTWLKERQTDLQEEPPALYTGGWERRWPEGWRSPGWRPAPSCWTCQRQPHTDLGRRRAKYDRSPPAAWSQHPAEEMERKVSVHHVIHTVCSAFWRHLDVCLCGWAGRRDILFVHVLVCPFTHLSPFFRQQVLQSLDKKNAEGALCCGLHLIDRHKQQRE